MSRPRDSSVHRRRAAILHDSFELGILLKGVHAVLELIGALLLRLMRPESLSRLVRLLTQNELSEDPRDLLANLILRASEHYSVSTQHFGVLYLLSHGIVKLVLVILLWRRKLWAYPAGIVVLLVFIGYQILRWTGTHSLFLLLLSLFDAAMIWLTFVEYRRLRSDPWKRNHAR
ncbi:MAG TPA: DUF2127 domain-containing protein [Rectinemataceae bacterium]|nr:DUF2127 domain-containing protein [Rectinemataceae bacterium]